jgi:NTE family protein
VILNSLEDDFLGSVLSYKTNFLYKRKIIMRVGRITLTLDCINIAKVIFVFTICIGLTACTAHYPLNKAISSVKSTEPYSIKKKADTGRTDDILLALTFSGGGTRAAAFSYGVLEGLADTTIVVNGKKRRLLDELDAISSVSGGSFTAAYYGLFGNRIFEDFETKFLKRNVQAELLQHVRSPLNWSKLWSSYYGRSDLAADYYDELLFENKTFQDFSKLKGPLIAINATDIALGTQFSFTGRQFAPICSDLSSFPVSRAVTASSAVPGAFTSIILKNHAGTCDFQTPEWVTEALRERSGNTRQYHLAKQLSSYLDTEQYSYIHLFDGGISDNLGIRIIINTTSAESNIWKTLHGLNLDNTTKLVIIVVNALKQTDVSFAKKDSTIPLKDVISAAFSAPLKNYSFETLELLKYNMLQWEDNLTAHRCQNAESIKGKIEKNPSSVNPLCTVKAYLVEVSFDLLQNDTERKHLEGLPTSFHLESEDIDNFAVF